MADTVKPKKQCFRAIDPESDNGQWITAEVADQVRDVHTTLEGASIIALEKLNWSADDEGNTKLADLVVVDEMTWRLFAQLSREEAAPDMILRLNGELFWLLPEAARRYVVDEALCSAAPAMDKEGEQAEDTTGRALWTKRKPDFVGFAGPIARHGAQTDRIKAFLQKATGGGQLELDAPPTRMRKPKADKPKLAREPEPVYYYERRTVDAYGPVALRFTEADRRVESLAGVRYLEEGDSAVLEELPYLTTKPEVREMRKALERERETWQPAHATDLTESAPAH